MAYWALLVCAGLSCRHYLIYSSSSQPN